MDATFVDAPRQRNNRDENEQIKNSKILEKLKKNSHKKSQKDNDVRWAKKRDGVWLQGSYQGRCLQCLCW